MRLCLCAQGTPGPPLQQPMGMSGLDALAANYGAMAGGMDPAAAAALSGMDAAAAAAAFGGMDPALAAAAALGALPEAQPPQ